MASYIPSTAARPLLLESRSCWHRPSSPLPPSLPVLLIIWIWRNVGPNVTSHYQIKYMLHGGRGRRLAPYSYTGECSGYAGGSFLLVRFRSSFQPRQDGTRSLSHRTYIEQCSGGVRGQPCPRRRRRRRRRQQNCLPPFRAFTNGRIDV